MNHNTAQRKFTQFTIEKNYFLEINTLAVMNNNTAAALLIQRKFTILLYVLCLTNSEKILLYYYYFKITIFKVTTKRTSQIKSQEFKSIIPLMKIAEILQQNPLRIRFFLL